MSVYVGIDVHRKRSQVAVVTEDGTVQLNKNTVNGTEPILRLIGDLPSGTPVAFEAAFGWGWLARLLEDYGFDPHLVHPLQCKAIASARLKKGLAPPPWPSSCARTCCRKRWIAPASVRQLRALLRHRAGLVRLRTQLQNRIHAVVADFGYDRSAATCPGRAAAGWPSSSCPQSVPGDRHGLPDVHRRPGPPNRPDRRRAAPARQDRPPGQGPDHAAGRRPVHRPGDAGRDRGHHPLPQCPQAGQLGRPDADGPRLGAGPSGTGTSPSKARPGCGGC